MFRKIIYKNVEFLVEGYINESGLEYLYNEYLKNKFEKQNLKPDLDLGRSKED